MVSRKLSGGYIMMNYRFIHNGFMMYLLILIIGLVKLNQLKKIQIFLKLLEKSVAMMLIHRTLTFNINGKRT